MPRTVTLTPSRRVMLGLIAYSSVTMFRNGAQEPIYECGYADEVNGHEINAIEWLVDHGYARFTTKNSLGFFEGPVLVTGKGREYLDNDRD